MHKYYYEAILQLRPSKKEILDFVKNQLSKRKDVFISIEKKLKTGLDLYISSQRFTRALGDKLKKSFKGELKITRSLYGINKQTSKKIYRVTVCFRLKPNSEQSPDIYPTD